MREEPCKVTGKECRWTWCCDPSDEERYCCCGPSDEEGDYCCCGMYCMDCYRDKDWEKKKKMIDSALVT